MNSAMSGFNSASNDYRRALRAQNAAMRELENARKAKDKGKSGKGGWLVIVIAAIIVFWLLSN